MKGVAYVDVAIVQSDADTYVNLGSHSCSKGEFVATNTGEKVKESKHGRFCRQQKWQLIPFV